MSAVRFTVHVSETEYCLYGHRVVLRLNDVDLLEKAGVLLWAVHCAAGSVRRTLLCLKAHDIKDPISARNMYLADGVASPPADAQGRRYCGSGSGMAWLRTILGDTISS